MGTDFFDELGVTLTRTAKEFGERAESLYETQKLRAKISGEERTINKLMAELGKTIYRAYAKGGELTDEQTSLCEKIDQHKEMIERCKAEMAGKKGKKICPSCKESVDKSVAFCPYCGAACPSTEPEEAAGAVVADADETEGEDIIEKDAAEEVSAEKEAPGFQGEPLREEAGPEESVRVEAEPEAGEED
ncbi:MAG: zinc ribbon domain-containing protein [Eubacteriales bacterium]|nr:zinc ribbon domain-containing protein [Eubacteriales bacterium]